MGIGWPVPGVDDRCALCGQYFSTPKDVVLTFDGDAERVWWHMECRDVMIPLLLGVVDEKSDANVNDES